MCGGHVFLLWHDVRLHAILYSDAACCSNYHSTSVHTLAKLFKSILYYAMTFCLLPFSLAFVCILIVFVIVLILNCKQISNDPSPGYNIEQMAKG